MTIKMPRNLMAAVSVVAFAALLSSCGGGGGGGGGGSPVADAPAAEDDSAPSAGSLIAGKTVPDGTTVNLPEGTDSPNVTFFAAQDETVTVAGIGTFTCLSALCSVAVEDDVVTTSGDIEVVSLDVTDADVLAELAAAVAAGEAPKPLPVDLAAVTAGYVIAAGTIEIPAGGTVIHGDVALTCSGSEACTVTIADDGTITSRGGACTAANSPLYVAKLEAARLEMEAADALVAIQTDAATAATAAKTAADNAASSATAATEAGANLATIQTGETSRGLATKASDQAALALVAYMAAKTASEAAAAATDLASAVRAQINAENALADAEAAAIKAGEYSQMAMDAAGNELMIEGTVKTVGGTSLDDTAGSSVVTTDGNTVETGLIKDKNPDTTVVMSMAVLGMDGDLTVAVNPYVAPVAAAEERTFDIGKVVDSADDMARLMIVTQYAGSKTVKVYNAGTDTEMGTKAGYLSIEDLATTETEVDNLALKSEGTYYPAVGGSPGDLDEANDVVAATAKPVEVFSFVDPNSSNVLRAKTYVVWAGENKTAAGITYTYTVVDIEVDHDVDGDSTTTDNNTQEVTATIPEGTDYKHIHFGVWAVLGAAEMDGSQELELSDLGIGFVQSIGDGLTGADMPNNGSGKYEGNWVAAVRAADEDGNGPIVLESGAALINANFGMDKITADLTDLATLEGAITTNTFSGIKASGIMSEHGLDADGEFTGTFSGGFYGSKAAEAGGIFDFTSKGAEAGEFRGAFGADRKLP